MCMIDTYIHIPISPSYSKSPQDGICNTDIMIEN